MRTALARIPPFAILAAAWFAFLLYAYPGLMTRDSFDQLRQARTGVFSDDHPPMMQAIVWLTDPLLAGPIGPVVVQSVMLLAGAYLLLRRILAPHIAALVAVAFFLFPPVVAVMTTMWKDPMMAGALVLATALLVSPQRRVRLVALALVVVATGVRFNALAGTFALVVLLFEWLPPRGSLWRRRVTRYGLALGVWVAATAAAFGINALLTDRETHFFETTLVDDVVGTLAYVPSERSDTALATALAGTRHIPQVNIHAALRKAYRSDTMLWLVVGNDRVFDLPLADVEPPGPELRAALVRAWKTVVFANPVAFLRYRADRFRVVLGLMRATETTWDEPIIVTHDYQDKDALWNAGVSTSISPMQAAVDRAMSWLSHTALFRPYVYFFLTLALLALSRRNALAAALLLSGLGMQLSLFFLAHSADYRYSHWMVCTTVLAAIVLFVQRFRSAHAIAPRT
ncbi:MAG TPA: hypothetical protein VK427_11050 [Kofleriaceae bacterium]|nr:hypothetical protein [Kofleriaceae bacterium]